MNYPLLKKIPLLIVEEKMAVMTSIISLLREKGFVVIYKELDEPLTQGLSTIEKFDGLAMLRFVTQNLQKNTPVEVLLANSNIASPFLGMVA